MASEAEARIRAKAEALLRAHWPDARIVHEFEVWGCRLDLAAITEDRLILVEIKSEKDTLSRLENQMRHAVSIGGPVLVCYAPRWADAIKTVPISERYRIEWLQETEGDFVLPYPRRVAEHADRYNNRRLLDLLLKPELFALAKPHGARARHTVVDLAQIAHENLNGREIRRAVMAALRARRFGWTCDEPVRIAA